MLMQACLWSAFDRGMGDGALRHALRRDQKAGSRTSRRRTCARHCLEIGQRGRSRRLSALLKLRREIRPSVRPQAGAQSPARRQS